MSVDVTQLAEHHAAFAHRLLYLDQDPIASAQLCTRFVSEAVTDADDPVLNFLIQELLPLVLVPDLPLANILRQGLGSDSELRSQCLEALWQYQKVHNNSQSTAALQQHIEELAVWPSSQYSPKGLTGRANVLYIAEAGKDLPSGCGFLYAWLSPRDGGPLVVGNPLPETADAGWQAASRYLGAAGCCDISDTKATCIIEGLCMPSKGPSLQLALCLAILSLRLDTPVPDDMAFTGRLAVPATVSETGYDIGVLPVDGISLKLRAATEVGIKKVFGPAGNNDDIDDETRELLAHHGCQWIPVSNLEEVIRQVFPSHVSVAPSANTERPRLCRPGHRWAYIVAASLLFGWLFGQVGLFEHLKYPQVSSFADATRAALIGGAAAALAMAIVLLWPYWVLRRNRFPAWRWAAFSLKGLALAVTVLYLGIAATYEQLPANRAILGQPWTTIGKDLLVYAIFALVYWVCPHAYLCVAEWHLDQARWMRARQYVEGGYDWVGRLLANNWFFVGGAVIAVAITLPLDFAAMKRVNQFYNTVFIYTRDVLLLLMLGGVISWFLWMRSKLVELAKAKEAGQQPPQPMT